MARSERNARRMDRSFSDGRPFIDPWFGNPAPGYSQPDAIDPTGYSLADLTLPGRLGDGMIPDDVTAPLGGERVGRVSVASYGKDVEPTPGGSVPTGLRPYGPDWAAPINPPELPTMEEAGAAGRPTGPLGSPGACSSKVGLGMSPEQLSRGDDTCYDGPGKGRMSGEPLWVRPNHAVGHAPLEYQSGVGVAPEHLQSTIQTGLDVYGGYQGLLNPGLRGGPGAYGAIYDGDQGDGGVVDRVNPPFSGGLGGEFGKAALSAVGYPVKREAPEDPQDGGVDPGANDGWGRIIPPSRLPRWPGEQVGDDADEDDGWRRGRGSFQGNR